MGHRGVIAIIAAQLGLAMSRSSFPMACGLISGMTSGTRGSIRNADELSTTVAPRSTAIGAKRFDAELPAEKRARSTPRKLLSVSSRTLRVAPRKVVDLSAERADAKRR